MGNLPVRQNVLSLSHVLGLKTVDLAKRSSFSPRPDWTWRTAARRRGIMWPRLLSVQLRVIARGCINRRTIPEVCLVASLPGSSQPPWLVKALKALSRSKKSSSTKTPVTSNTFPRTRSRMLKSSRSRTVCLLVILIVGIICSIFYFSCFGGRVRKGQIEPLVFGFIHFVLVLLRGILVLLR